MSNMSEFLDKKSALIKYLAKKFAIDEKNLKKEIEHYNNINKLIDRWEWKDVDRNTTALFIRRKDFEKYATEVEPSYEKEEITQDDWLMFRGVCLEGEKRVEFLRSMFRFYWCAWRPHADAQKQED